MEENIKIDVEKYILDRYHVVPEHPWAKYPEHETFKEIVTGKWFAIIMHVKKSTIGISSDHGDKTMADDWIYVMNVKSDPDTIGFLSRYDGLMPGYHMNKQNWLSIFLDGSVEMDQILDLLDTSYKAITDTPTHRIYEAVKRIPKGHVATYGQVAAMAGNPKMSRAVGNALHKNPDPDNIPCFRVVNAAGHLADGFAFGGADVQANLLRAEGVEVQDNIVDLNKYGVDDINIDLD